MSQKVIEIGGKNIELLKALGQGTYGSVYLINTPSGPQAIKVITNDLLEGIKSLREIDIMSKIRHENLVRATGILVSSMGGNTGTSKATVGIIMPLAKGNLYNILTDPSFTILERIKVLYQITLGTKQLHKSGYLHLDLKPLNILMFEGKNAKITDFGISMLMEKNNEVYYPSELVTISHRPIDVLNGNKKYSPATDIWSLGMIFLEVLSYGKTIFPSYDRKVVKTYIETFLNKFVIDKTLDTLGITVDKELIKSMLSFDPLDRPTIEEVLTDPLFYGNYIGNNDSNIKYIKPKPPRKCDIIYYYGYDTIIRIFLKYPEIKLETFFLAVDIYQRSLAFSNKLTGNRKTDWANVSLIANTSIYMAIKMLEPYHPDPVELAKFSSNIFTPQDIVITEGALVQLFDGIIYHKNLFTETNTKQNLLKVFKSLGNCHLYSRIDLDAWSQMNRVNGDYNKYIPFINFFNETSTKDIMVSEIKEVYIPRLYKQDLKIL